MFLGGDHIDFYQLSKFDKDPERRLQLQDDLDSAYTLLRRYRRAAGDRCKLYYLEGNHEERLQKFLLRTAPELLYLRSLSIENLLRLRELGIEYVPGGVKEYRGYVFKHGNLASAKGGYTAQRELDTWWKPGMSGHTHRLALIWKTAAQGDIPWLEAGCGCLQLEYIKGRPADWQTGMAYADYDSDRRLWVPVPVKITRGAARVEGEWITP